MRDRSRSVSTLEGLNNNQVQSEKALELIMFKLYSDEPVSVWIAICDRNQRYARAERASRYPMVPKWFPIISTDGIVWL